MSTGYCTVEDVRRVMQESDLSAALASENNKIVVDAIDSISTTVEKATKCHWYAESAPSEDDHGLVPTGPKTRDDEESIPTGGAHLVGEPATPKTWQGSYTRLELARRDAESISELLVRTPDGYVDWTIEYEGGLWPDALGADYYLRINNGGVSHLYLDSENLLNEDDEPLLDSFSNAVYVSFSYGHPELPQNVRRGVALLAASELVIDDEFVTSIPDNGQFVSLETKSERWGRQGIQKLEPYIEDAALLDEYR
ncbi:hypothetical protein [Natrinema salifodinae]|uniref:Uncharacterized protein n=1 Tax=Natrinema salifodinae TaxID=1202768 RepID=A0A1I0P7K5_9EURY|nr:hypothetical protein [Natrinema salifodinae]SEW10329.1 hypothetical protein SAMN05216285_2248 [Natrinema salifodinae]